MAALLDPCYKLILFMRYITSASVDDTVTSGSSKGSERGRTQRAAFTSITIVSVSEA